MGTDDADDPLKGADIGETRTVTREQTLHGINYAPLEFVGSDRQSDGYDIVDVEIIETDEEDFNDIRVTWEGEVTKQLPLRWDHHDEPITAEEKRQARRKKWLSRVGQAMAFILPAVIATVIAGAVMNQMSGVMINGEPMGPVTPTEMVGPVILVIGMAALISYGLKGGFPGKVQGR